jgi:hypothetical protein
MTSDLRLSSIPSELRELRPGAATPALSAIGQTALAYARRGWHVGPCRITNDGRKVPKTLHGFKDFTDDEAKIIAWWHDSPNALIGVWLGPSRLAVLDVDRHEGKPAGDLHDLDGIISAKDTDTPAEWTLSGGEHFWYHAPDSAQLPAATALAAGLELLAGDKLAIISPSAGYSWMPGYGIEDIPLRPLPDGLRFAIPAKRRATASSGAPASPDAQARFGAILGALGIDVTPDAGDVLVQCVFHADATPSLHVDARRAIFHCFAPSCAAHPGGGLRKLAELAKMRHGIVLPAVTPAMVLPWAVTDDERRQCATCSEIWHDVHASGAGVAGGFRHGSCHKRSCPVWRKVRAGQLLRDVPTWGGSFAQTVTPAAWRRIRETISKRNGRFLRVPQADGSVLAITDTLGDGWHVITLAAVFEAVADSIGRIGRPHADRLTPDGATAASESATASSFVGLAKSERIDVLTLENDAVQPDEQKAILRALRLKGIGPAERDEVRELWRRAGFTVNGDAFSGSWDNARRLVQELQDWAAARCRKGRASIAALSVSGCSAAFDGDGSQTGGDDLREVQTCHIPAPGSIPNGA